jgi:large conductance mechanosensitive channel
MHLTCRFRAVTVGYGRLSQGLDKFLVPEEMRVGHHMGGFKKFLLQGDLISLAVAFIIGGAFGTVVTALVTVILDLIGKAGGTPNFSSWQPGGVHLGAFLTALIAFVILAAVVYFLIVVPYTRAKERFFPSPDPGPTELDTLREIRDLLAAQQTNSSSGQ